MRSVGLGLALVASIQFAVAPAFAQDPKSAAPAAATPAAPAVAPGTVIVHINSESKVTLEKRSGAHSAWEHVCNSPCDVAAAVADQYQIIGDTLNPSQPFLLDASGGDKVTLDVTPGVHNKAARGGWILAAGAIVIVGGIIVLAAGSKATTAPGDDGTVTNNTNTDFISLGSAIIVVGVITAMTGGAFMYDNAHTKVEGSIGDVPEGSDKGGNDLKVKASVQVTAQRAPTWHHDLGPQLAPSQFVSIFHGTF